MKAGSQVVMKFGGTSVGRAVRFRQCASIVKDAMEQHRVIIVVSAVAGITDLIVNTMDAAGRGDAGAIEANLATFDALHRQLIDELFQHGRLHEQVQQIVAGYGNQLRDSCRALCALGLASPPETSDLLLALGEKIAACILANYLCTLGVQAQFVRAEDAIITDHTFGNAVPDMEATRKGCEAHVLSVLDRRAVPVVAGYSGATATGQTTTLGRGGSDYSATIIGAATASDAVWIWTDVDGVLTADPRVCPDATTLPEISFTEAIDLAYYGAKVIHRKAIYPAQHSGLPVWIKNSFCPEAEGTRIGNFVREIDAPLDAVTCLNPATLITLVARHEAQSSELFGRLFLRMGQEQIDVLLATQSFPQGKLELVVRKEDSIRVLSFIRAVLRSELAGGVLSPVAVRNDVAVVAVLGGTGQSAWRSVAAVFSVIAERHIDLLALARGSGERSICFAMPAASSAEVVCVLHQELTRRKRIQVPLRNEANICALAES